MYNGKKCVVGHAGARDFYQVALALYEAGLLDALATDCFVPDFLVRFTKRPSSGLPLNKVKISPIAFWNFLKEKAPFLPTPMDYVKKDTAISSSSLNIALAHDSNLFLYSYYAHDAFYFLKKNNYKNKRILFQVHPHPLSIRRILNEDIDRLPYTRSSIENESEFLIKSKTLDKLCQEIHLSDHCVAASSFTKSTLIENGADPEKMSVIPYGVDANKFPRKKFQNKKSPDCLSVIFIGSMVQRKGLADLLLAFKILKSKKIKLTLVGYKMDKQLIEHFSGCNFKILVNATHETLLQEMHAADVFVLPSLAEGFGHVILEAMSTGLPVITTYNTAGPDIMEDGIEGYLIPAKSPEAIAEKLEILLKDKGLCESMGQAAATKAQEFNWQNFRFKINVYYKSLIAP